jgi:hypothetical protein
METGSFPLYFGSVIKNIIFVGSLLNLLKELNEIILCAPEARIILFYSTRSRGSHNISLFNEFNEIVLHLQSFSMSFISITSNI